MSMPYETTVELPHSWDAVFEAVQRCCDGRRRILLSKDPATGRIVVHVRSTLSYWGASLVVDVGRAPGGSRIRIGALSATVVDFRLLLRFHVRNFLNLLVRELELR